MPYRIDLRAPSAEAFDRLMELGAMDIEPFDGGIAAIMPDTVAPVAVTAAVGLRTRDAVVSPAVGRDDGSVWVLSTRPVRAGRVQIVPSSSPAEGALRMIDGPAFGTGLHPTTALCLEAIDAEVGIAPPARALDVGTGSGILALAAIALGVPHVVGLDNDAEALRLAAANARLNGQSSRLSLVWGDVNAISGSWPLVVANVLAAPLMDMAPALTRRVGSRGRLVLSGIPSSVTADVERVYRNLGMHQLRSELRSGWAVLVLQPSW
jgi:ribosomal protein L11 methyltransferase